MRCSVSPLSGLTDACRGLEIYTPFANLPTRTMTDYYKTITHPVSIKKVAKLTKGIRGRNDVTGVTEFKTWEAFEEEVSYIWLNARVYNEDGSDIYLLANEFEVRLESRDWLTRTLTMRRSTSSPCLRMQSQKSKSPQDPS